MSHNYALPSRKSILILSLLTLSLLGISGLHPAHATNNNVNTDPNSVNVLPNTGFEHGTHSCSQVSQQCPVGWDFETCEGVRSATVALDSTKWTNGSYSARIATGPLGSTGCTAGYNYTGRPVGFSQFRAAAQPQGGPGYNFTQLTDSPNGFSFWFQLQPYDASTGMAGFEIRVFGAESTAELDYAVNPDPSIGSFQNSTGLHALTFTGYQFGQWYHFTRDLKADWMNSGLPLNHNFTLVQFQGFATLSGSIMRSETYWLDDVRLYAQTPINVITNPSFEQGPQPCASVPSQQCPTSWDFATCEGVANATVNLDTSNHTDGATSAKIITGPVTPTGCLPGNFTGRAVGFSQFRQGLSGQGLNFTQLTDTPEGFSFSFRLQPANSTSGMAGFEVRVFGAESLAELDYVFNPDPSVGLFQNNTSTHSLIFNGYQPGLWYNFSRDLKTDWMTPMGPANTPLNLNYNLTLVQFQGFATKSGNIAKSETYWLDNVRLSEDTGVVPSEKFYSSWVFKDPNNNNANSLLNWTLTDSTGQVVSYVQGQPTLTPGPYFVQTYYRTFSPTNLILTQEIHLNQTNTIPVLLYPTSLVPGGYIALNNPLASISINTPDPSRTIVTMQGITGTQYTMIADVPSKPVLIQANGYDLNQGYDWTYDTALSAARISFNMAPVGENITILLQQAARIPSLSFVDLEGATLGPPRISFNILDSQGRTIAYNPGAILPPGTFYVEAYYQGFRIYRNNIANIGIPTITLQMTILDQSSNSYLALNSTATSISPTQFNSSQIAFNITGTGPYLIVLNVPKRPLYVEENGVRTPDWVYNATNQVISIESSGPGSFLVVFDQPSISGTLDLAIGLAAATVAAVIAIYAWRKRLKSHTPPFQGEGRT